MTKKDRATTRAEKNRKIAATLMPVNPPASLARWNSTSPRPHPMERRLDGEKNCAVVSVATPSPAPPALSPKAAKLLTITLREVEPVGDQEQGAADQQDLFDHELDTRRQAAKGIGGAGEHDRDDQERLKDKPDIPFQNRQRRIHGPLDDVEKSDRERRG